MAPRANRLGVLAIIAGFFLLNLLFWYSHDSESVQFSATEGGEMCSGEADGQGPLQSGSVESGGDDNAGDSGQEAEKLGSQLSAALRKLEQLQSEKKSLEETVQHLSANKGAVGRVAFTENEVRWKSLAETESSIAPYTQNIAKDALKGKNICFVTAGLQGPVPYGGIGQATYRQSRLYAEHGANVTILYVGPFQRGDAASWTPKLKEEGLMLEIPVLHDGRFSYGTARMRVSHDVLLNLIEKERKGIVYDMIIFHDLYGFAHYPIAEKRSGGQYLENTVIVVHGHGSSQLSNFFNARSERLGSIDLVTYSMERRTMELADFALSPSEWYFDWMVRNGYNLRKETSFTMLNLAPPELETAPAADTMKSDRFAFFGRLERLKGLFVFLDALDQMASSGGPQPSKVKFIGNEVLLDAPEGMISSYEYIRQRSKAWTFPYSIVSDKTSMEVINYLREKKYILVNPTLGETASLVALEAATAGIPVIISNVSAIPELFADRKDFSAISFPRGDTETLVQRMTTAIQTGIPVMAPRLPAENTRNLYLGMALYALDKKNQVPYPGRRSNVLSSHKTSVTIGVPTVDRMKEVEECLQSFADMEVADNLQVKVMLMYAGKSDDVFAVKQAMIEKMQPQFTAKKMQLTMRRMEHPGFASAARNEIFRLADTEFVLLFDDDDIAHPKMLSRMVGTALATGGKVVTGFAQNFDVGSDGERVLGSVSLALGSSPESSLLIHHVGKATMLLHLETVRSVGGCTMDVDTENTPFIDWDLYSKLQYAGFEVEVIPDVVYSYRKHSVNSIYYSMKDKRQTYFYGHHKRVMSFCRLFNIPARSCLAVEHMIQQHAQPSGLTDGNPSARRSKS